MVYQIIILHSNISSTYLAFSVYYIHKSLYANREEALPITKKSNALQDEID